MHHSRQPLLGEGQQKKGERTAIPPFVNQLQQKATPLCIKCKADVSCRSPEVAIIQDMQHLI